MRILILLCVLTTSWPAQALLCTSIRTFTELSVVEEDRDTSKFIPMYYLADEYPEYPGGEKEMIAFIQTHISYPELAYNHGHEGTVIIGLVIQKDGKVSDLKVIRSVGLGCDEAALEVFKKMPLWKPAIQGGKAIPVKYIVPVRFSLF